MKKFFYIILIVSLSGCGNFLEEYSQSLVVVKTVSDLDEILLGEVYLPSSPVSTFSAANYASFMNFMDDDINTVITRRGNANAWKTLRNLYGYSTWQLDVTKSANGSDYINDNSLWMDSYHRINIINIILGEMSKLEIVSEEDKSNAIRIKGECYFLRAQLYFFLVNLYALPYDNKAEKCLGVPLKLTEYVENDFHRNTVNEVYAQIVKDLKDAVDNLTKSPQKKPAYRASKEASLLLLSRVYLYMQDWENARDAANEFLELTNELYPISSLPKTESFMEATDSEVVFAQGTLNINRVFTANGGDFCISNDLYNLYLDNDYRRDVFFSKNFSTDSIMINRKYSSTIHQAKVSDVFTLRIAEGYLNMAEACAMLDDAEANTWLNDLRRNRIADYKDKNYTGEELVKEIRDERRKELCLEGHRWFDLRRYSVNHKYPYSKEIVRVFAKYNEEGSSFEGAELFKLEKNDLSYVFKIPESVLEYHADMPNNERKKREVVAKLDENGKVIEDEETDKDKK